MFPWLKALGWLLVAGGTGTLIVYNQLPRAKREEADQLLADFAVEMYQKKLTQLTSAEAQTVHDRVRRHFTN